MNLQFSVATSIWEPSLVLGFALCVSNVIDSASRDLVWCI